MSLSSRETLVRLESKRSSPPRTESVEDVIVVEHRMHDRLLRLVVVHVDRRPPGSILLGVLALHVEIVAAQVEEVAVAEPGQIEGRGEVLGGRRRRCGSRG